jgi:hypothetical protein
VIFLFFKSKGGKTMTSTIVFPSSVGEKDKVREPFGEARIRDYNVAIQEDTRPPKDKINEDDPLSRLELVN